MFSRKPKANRDSRRDRGGKGTAQGPPSPKGPLQSDYSFYQHSGNQGNALVEQNAELSEEVMKGPGDRTEWPSSREDCFVEPEELTPHFSYDQHSCRRLDPNAKMERILKEMEDKQKAELEKIEAEEQESLKKIREDSKIELQKSKDESAQLLRQIITQHEHEMREKDLTMQKESEEFEALKQKKNKLATEEFEAKERAQKELLSHMRRKAEEEDKRLQSELEDKIEDQVTSSMLNYDEEKIQVYMEIEENRKKMEEDVQSYVKAAEEKTQEKVMKIKEELRNYLYNKK